jgi:hypothetical protein
MTEIQRTATISKDGRFRYRLGRRWGDGPNVLTERAPEQPGLWPFPVSAHTETAS